MFLNAIYIAVGLVLLILGAHWLVEGASGIAKKLGISTLTIGLTVVAFGTSAPELSVNIISAMSGNTDIAIGNVLGSNIFNVFTILGIAALIKPIGVQAATIKVEIPFNLLAAVVLAVVANDVFIDRGSVSVITRVDGIVLLLLFCVFMYYNFLTGRSDSNGEDAPAVGERKGWLSSLMVIGGLGLLVGGGKLIVDGAVDIANALGISQSVIALTIVAAGTSLPELATSAIAAYKNKPDIAIGNVVGSCVFNVLFILGASSAIKPLPTYPGAGVDLGMNVLAGMFMLILAMLGPGRKIDRREGAILVAIYTAYTVFLIYKA